MRTQGNFNADTAHQGGFAWFGAGQISGISANLALTRNALGDYSLNRIAAGAETYNPFIQLTLPKRLVEVSTSGMPFQEQFGVASGTAGYPAGAAGMPPFTGVTQLTQPTAPPNKGIKILDVVIAYQVGVVALTSLALSLNRTVYANAVAPAVTNLPISATALTLLSAATPYLATRTVTTPAFEVTDLSDLSLEATVVMANTGTFRLYGFGFHYDFNFD